MPREGKMVYRWKKERKKDVERREELQQKKKLFLCLREWFKVNVTFYGATGFMGVETMRKLS